MAVLKISILLFTHFFLRIHASYHWIVTENGKIQSQGENSAFPLRRPHDLLALLEQEESADLYKELMFKKRSIDIQWSKIEGEGILEKIIYATDPDCVRGALPLLQHDLNTDFVDYSQGSRPKMKTGKILAAPDCRMYYNLDFSMTTFPHLPVLNKRDNFNLTVNPVPSETDLDFDVNLMLERNSHDWTAYNLASLYWRLRGNGSNAIECARRAVYFATRNERYIALLNLGTLLQQLGSHGESAIVLHSAVDHDPAQHISHMALGNIYAALSDYTRALACYENVLSLFPAHIKALQLKHAVYCHKKVESSLLGVHSSLQNILQDLQKYNEMLEKWLHLQNQISWERDDKQKDLLLLNDPVSINLQMVLQNVEDQAKSLKEEVSKKVFRKSYSNSVGGRVQKNQLKTESVFDCNVENCPGYIYQERVKDLEDKLPVLIAEERNLMGSLGQSEDQLTNKVDTLITLMNSMKRDPKLNVKDFKQQISRQINHLKELKVNVRFSKDQVWFLNNLDSCMRSYQDSLPLTECLLRILDKYRMDVSNRLNKLKEKMNLINELSVHEMRRDDFTQNSINSLTDESTLENYIEPSLMFENLKDSEPCQRFRDTTEL